VTDAYVPKALSCELQVAFRQFELVRVADCVAAAAHAATRQTRRDGHTPYIDHPRSVATLLAQWRNAGEITLTAEEFEVLAAAALLHDVIEDTQMGYEYLRELIGDDRVMHLVALLTKSDPSISAPAGYYHAIGCDRLARILKAADRIANLCDALALDDTSVNREWICTYLAKTQASIVPMLVGDPRLQSKVVALIERFGMNAGAATG